MSVKEYHDRIDTFIRAVFRQPQNLKPCCVKGCFACCYESVYASNSEADYILEGMSDEQKEELKQRLPAWLEQVKPAMEIDMPKALQYRALNAPCPLLKDGLCSVYERRPFGCRSFFATGNPKLCDLQTREHQKFIEYPTSLYEYIGAPPTINGTLVLEHLGILLAERLLGSTIKSASRKEVTIE